MLQMFPTKGLFNAMKARHELWKEKYPDTQEARGMPFTGIANARPETIEASRPRFESGEVPLDIEELMRKSKIWEGFEGNWGVEK